MTSHINAARKAIGDNGQEQRLIRTIARKGFRFVGDVGEIAAATVQPLRRRSACAEQAPADALPLPDKPSIAALPFLNLSGDAEQEYFTDGVVEDIISALSRIRWLFVIARNSSFTYKGRAVDVKQVGRELGVRYVLEGSVRKAANRVRITGQLVDATTGGHLWAERYEGALDDIFELQDRITESVVGAIAHELERAEIERAKRKPTESLDAYDYFLRGMASFHAGTPASIDQALRVFARRSRSIPNTRRPMAWPRGACFGAGSTAGRPTTPRRLPRARAWRAAPSTSARTMLSPLTRGGHALAHFTRDLDAGDRLSGQRRSCSTPISRPHGSWAAILRIWRGEPDEAIKRFEHAMRLSPLDSEMFRMQTGIAMAHLIARRFDAACAWAEKAHRDVPIFVLSAAAIAASSAHAGRMDEARRAMRITQVQSRACGLPPSTQWLPFNGRKISRRSRTACERRGCPNNKAASAAAPVRLRSVKGLAEHGFVVFGCGGAWIGGGRVILDRAFRDRRKTVARDAHRSEAFRQAEALGERSNCLGEVAVGTKSHDGAKHRVLSLLEIGVEAQNARGGGQRSKSRGGGAAASARQADATAHAPRPVPSEKSGRPPAPPSSSRFWPSDRGHLRRRAAGAASRGGDRRGRSLRRAG